MKYILTISTLCLAACFTTNAQQDPLYAQYLNNPFVINPAYAGFTNNLSTAVSYRQQWAGLEGGPKTVNFNSHIALSENRMGAGILVVSDRIGNSLVNEGLAAYAYKIALSEKQTLSFGLQAGFANYQIDNNKVNPFDKSDPLFIGSVSETVPSFGAGLILSTDRYFLGVSMPRMLKTTLQEQGLQSTLYSQHFYGVASYLFIVSEHIRFKPSTLIKLVRGAPASFDLNASFIFHENYQAGLLTRDFSTYGFFGQIQVRDAFRLGFVFEVPTGASVGSDFVTYELTLGLRFNALPGHSNTSVLSF